jgi:hypothetical protein
MGALTARVEVVATLDVAMAQREVIKGVTVQRRRFGEIGQVGAYELARRVAKAAMDQALLVDAAASVAVASVAVALPEG